MKEGIKEYVTQYYQLREQKKLIEARMKEIGNKIKKYVTQHGVRDSNGNYYMEEDNFIFGQQARKTVKLNEEKAKEFLKQKGLYDLVVEKVEKINEEKLGELVQNEEITMEELEDITDVKVTYAIDVKIKEAEEDKPENMPEVQVVK